MTVAARPECSILWFLTEWLCCSWWKENKETWRANVCTLPGYSTVQRLKPKQGCSAIPQTHESSEQMHKAHIWKSFDDEPCCGHSNPNTWKTLFPSIVRWEITIDELDNWSLHSSCSLPHWALLHASFLLSLLSPTHTSGTSSTCSGLRLCWEGRSRLAIMGPDSTVSLWRCVSDMCIPGDERERQSWEALEWIKNKL